MKKSTSVFLIIVALGLFYTFINPQYKRDKTLSEQSSRYKEVLSDVSELEQTRDELLVQYEAMPAEDKASLEKLLPDNLNTVKLANDLDTIGSKYGLTLDSLKVNTEKEDNSSTKIKTTEAPYEKIPVSFSVISTYPNFVKFMQDVEDNLRIADVRTVAFQSTENGIYEFNVDIETYSMNQQ